MHQRNPFTAISNYSFVRNASQFSSNRPASRSCSGENRFNDYQGMYLRDSYLLERESRKNQETLASRLMGLEALRYEAQPSTQRNSSKFQSNTEYYNTQTLSSPPPSLPLSSDCHTFNQNMKTSTKDMFNSDYFSRREPQESNEDDKIQNQCCKPSAFKKQGQVNSRFKQTVSSCQLDQVIQKSQTFISNTQKTQSMKGKSKNVLTVTQFGDPETIFLKSKRTLFFRYHDPFQNENQC